MPKIGYYIGTQAQTPVKTEVTKEFLQQKIAVAKALLQGNIDLENIVARNLNTNVIKDFPDDVTGFDNCMKFFHFSKDDDPYTDLFKKLVAMCKASPDVAVVGGTQDSEMSATFTIEKKQANDESEDGSSGAVSETYNLKKELEIPPNYEPMTWGELADLMVANGFTPKVIKIDSDKGELYLDDSLAVIKPKEYILSTYGKQEDEIVETMNYWRDGNSTKVNVDLVSSKDDLGKNWAHDVQCPVVQVQCDFPKCESVLKRNVLSYSTYVKFEVNLAKVKPGTDTEDLKYLDSEGFATVKLVPEILCKVI